MTAPQIEPVAVAVVIATALVGPQLAEAVGAYAIILVAWFFGVFGNIYWREPRPRSEIALFAVLTFGVSVGMTVPLAQFIVKMAPEWVPSLSGLEAKALLFPVAFAIPAFWHKWPQWLVWAWQHRPWQRSQS